MHNMRMPLPHSSLQHLGITDEATIDRSRTDARFIRRSRSINFLKWLPIKMPFTSSKTSAPASS